MGSRRGSGRARTSGQGVRRRSAAILIGAALAFSGAAVSGSVSAAAATCDDAYFIGARGSGEAGGFGAVVEVTKTIVENRLGARVGFYAVPYPAIPVEDYVEL